MTLPNLATADDATSFGYTLPVDTASALLKRASARVRRSAGFPISSVTTTVDLYSDGRIELPPLTTSVTDVKQSDVSVDYTRRGSALYTVCGDVVISLTVGYATVPDGIIELVCSIADRLQNDSSSSASMLQQEMVGQTMRLWKVGSEQAASDLSNAELVALKKCIPNIKSWMVRCI